MSEQLHHRRPGSMQRLMFATALIASSAHASDPQQHLIDRLDGQHEDAREANDHPLACRLSKQIRTLVAGKTDKWSKMWPAIVDEDCNKKSRWYWKR